MMVKLNDVVVNIGKHLVVIFENNNNCLNEGSLSSGEIHNWDCDTSINFKRRGFEIRSGQMRSGKRLNRIIRDRGERFKVTNKSHSDKANRIIAKLRFQHSHQVEATGFTGGIWVGWKDSVQVEIMCNHPQFILLQVLEGNNSQPILIAFCVWESR
ncbi:hypothetical protein Gohar_008407 [Gossypium harknessii]|uniref:Uncharacterized protein n=1 Tax=Gossypium harknessii TaxID=34285 RepID=A0A7J9GJK5_9ROSI|nr:hypothetical protein [Gossypium harknessii]